MNKVCSPRRRPIKRLAITGAAVCVCFVVTSAFALTEARPTNSVVVHKRLQMAVTCLFSAKWMRHYFFMSFGRFNEGDWVSARYYVGTIPGMGPTPGAYKILFYAKDGKHAFLLDAEPNGRGGFFASQNDYTLKKNSRWRVIEGEGGDRDYEAIERLVSRMLRQPVYRVQLLTGGKECTDN